MKKLLKTMVWLLLIALLLVLGGVAFLYLAPQIGGSPSGERLRRIEASPRYKDGSFQNVIETSLDMSARQMVESTWKVITGIPGAEPDQPIRTVPFDQARFAGTGSPDEVAVGWFGHSSLLIRIEGQTLLTDPVFGERASVVSFLGPKRFPYDRYMDVAGLPPVDAVLLSHDHYDHLDYGTVQQLRGKVKRFIVPLGVGAHLEQWGIDPAAITELDWHESTKLGQLTLVCAPARHFSGRGFRRNGTLWCSWVLLGTQKRVYHGADSGYSPSFRAIGAQYGPFDLALLECGAYNEAWASIHMMPEETAQAARDLNTRLLMPIHWAKFNLALHTWRDPIRRLLPKAAELGVPLATPRIGEVLVLGQPVPTTPWWEEVGRETN